MELWSAHGHAGWDGLAPDPDEAWSQARRCLAASVGSGTPDPFDVGRGLVLQVVLDAAARSLAESGRRVPLP